MQPTCQETAQTELAQYIAAPPEMPEGEMELNRGDRKKLAELMLEYRPNENSQELAQQEETPPEQKWKYTCPNCNRPFSSTMGKFNHIRRRPDCQNVSQIETFGNKRNDCGRTFDAPVHLWGHRKYICADVQKTMPTQEKPKREKAKKIEQMQQILET